MTEFLNPAKEIAKKAGILLLKNYKKLGERDIFLKGHREFVTKVDIKSSKMIVDFLKIKFPKHNIVSEEQDKIDRGSDYTWIVDPLDGTTNYIMQNPIFSVSIGLVRANEIQMGVINAPFLKEFYTVEKDGQALLNDDPMHVSKEDSIKDSLIAFCSGHKKMHKEKTIKIYKNFKLRAKSLRQLGSASLELAYVAGGRLEGFMMPGIEAWDESAGVLMVQKAGGRVTDFKGNDWTLRTRDMLATNGKMHEDIINILEEGGL